MKRYDSYKDSGVEWIGEIPSHWECIRLGMLGDFSSSGIDKKTNDNETPVRMVNYTDIIQSRKYYPVQTGEKEYMRVTTPQSKLEEHRLKKGDMVFIPSSETHEDLGYSSLIDFEEEDIVYSYHILRYKIKKTIHHYYKKYLINHHSVLNQFSSECKGTTRQIIGRDVFNNVRVVLPPLSEQQQIVSFLDTKTSLIDSLIEKTQRKIELLKKKRTSLINEVVTKGLNPNVEMKDSGVEWIGEIPSHWVLSKVMYVLEFHNNVRIPLSSEDRGKRQGEYRYYGSTGIIDYIDDYLFDGEYILIGEDGSNLRLRTYRLSNVVSGKFWVNNHSHILRSKDGNNHYYSHLLELTDFSNYITGSTQPKLTMDNLKIVPMISPPLNEQQQIVEYLDEHTQLIDKTISIEEKRIELLKEYRQSIISEVVTGKLKVTTNE